MNDLKRIEQEMMDQGLTATEIETFFMRRVTVTIAPVRGSTVISIEARDPRKDGVHEAKAFVVYDDCHINDCRQDAEELGIDLTEAIKLANQPDPNV